MHLIFSFLAARTITSLILRLAIPLTILMALYKGYEYIAGVFS